MSKQYTNHQANNKFIFNLLIVLMIFSSQIQALKSDKDADFVLMGDNFINLPEVKDGLSQIKYWGNISIEQGTLKVSSDEAIVHNNKDGITKIELTGNPVEMEQFIDTEFGKLEVVANKIDFMVKDDMLIMTGNVSIKSKIQGEMSGEKITMNLKTKEIKGVKAQNQRVKLILKPKSKEQ